MDTLSVDTLAVKFVFSDCSLCSNTVLAAQLCVDPFTEHVINSSDWLSADSTQPKTTSPLPARALGQSQMLAATVGIPSLPEFYIFKTRVRR